MSVYERSKNMNICKRHVEKLQRAENGVYVEKKTKTLANAKRKRKRKMRSRARHEDVNALKVCGLNQGHFMNASDYMSVCQSTRKVNNPFVVGSFVGWLVGWQRAAAWLELVWLSVVDVSAAVLIPPHCCCSRFALLICVCMLSCVCSRVLVCVFTVPKFDALLTLPHFSLYTNVCDMFLFASSSSSSVIFG